MGGRGMAQVQDAGCLRMQLMQLKTARSPTPAVGCVLTPVLWWVLRSHRVAWPGPEPLPCPPGPRQLSYKRAELLGSSHWGRDEQGEAMDFVSIQQLVRTCSRGPGSGLGTPRPSQQNAEAGQLLSGA